MNVRVMLCILGLNNANIIFIQPCHPIVVIQWLTYGCILFSGGTFLLLYFFKVLTYRLCGVRISTVVFSNELIEVMIRYSDPKSFVNAFSKRIAKL